MNKLDLGIQIIKKINANGFEAYIVGGAVRDYLLGIDILDIDITTNALPDDLKKLFKVASLEASAYQGIKIIEAGIEFEITSFRKDLKYIDHRHPKTEIASSLEEDLARRDFTINALAMNSNYEIIDNYNGRADLKKKLIKTIREPKVRFDEDALRVLRAVYFAGKLDFDLDKKIIDSFKNDYVKYLAEEHVIKMLKTICACPYDKGLFYLTKYNILRSYPVYQVIANEAYKYQIKDDIFALFYLLHNFLPKNIKLSNQEIKDAKAIVYLINQEFNDESLYYTNEIYFKRAILLYNVYKKEALNLNDILNRKNLLAINNSKDIDFDFSWVKPNLRGQYIKVIEKAILSHKISNNPKEIKNYLESGEFDNEA